MRYFDFHNVRLLPRKCRVQSRAECDSSVNINGFKFRLPIIPANMASVVSAELCYALARRGYFYIMHRFQVDSLLFVKQCRKQQLVSSISVGIKDYDCELIKKLQQANLPPDFITIDVAHAHSHRVRTMIALIKRLLPKAFLTVGNIATAEAARDLTNWGADMLKIGIGPGAVCTTKNKTGFGTADWQLSALELIHQATKLPLILDGGLREPGDIAKSIRFGASFCMLGYMLAGFLESPGKLVTQHGRKFKSYYGSASTLNKKTTLNVEGIEQLLPLKKSIWTFLHEIEQNVKSSISYAGGTKLSDLRYVDFVIVKHPLSYQQQ